MSLVKRMARLIQRDMRMKRKANEDEINKDTKLHVVRWYSNFEPFEPFDLAFNNETDAKRYAEELKEEEQGNNISIYENTIDKYLKYSLGDTNHEIIKDHYNGSYEDFYNDQSYSSRQWDGN